ncbi:EpsG family protein [Streptococcus intermedius]|uniref:EpsG family protein n=1 Tax=Streptococcus intermedius TaxID=1338 RepID=UPI001F604864|nr:EpsG family protein [Streptococcus intermedius]MCI3917995.1 EpsG family protein [Streptococcus intermedius]
MISFLLYCTFIILGILVPKNKIIFFIQLSLIFTLVAFNYQGYDMLEYNYMFQVFGKATTIPIGGEFIYRWLMQLFFARGFSFFDLNLITSIIATIIIAWFMLKHTKRPSLAMSMLMIYPMFDLGIQKRNYIAMAVMLIALTELFDDKPFSKIRYFFWNLLAIGFHSTYLIYLLYPLYKFISKFNPKTIFFITLVTGGVLINFAPSLAGIFFDNDKVSLYFSDNSMRLSLFSAIAFIVVQILFMIFIWYMQRREKTALSNLSRDLILYTGIPLPLYFYNSNFIRLFRNLLPLHYLALANSKEFSYPTFLNMKVLPFLFIIYEIGVSILFYAISGVGWEKLIVPLFKYNYVFQLIG